ncbi:hypothetical protein K435DRAFT_821801 [Dendrothele bispora CBS 962.96]|uniref:Uncharacterized protein n=1 Tax=Dendrothele bispora (strain CBS 962.96) TaxID=1314807 RepID=A0A4S8LGE0_DENBC|nr:hypothetical protein K435DRAFT_821801 [Dendrothele bispora CBS 962.96]
MDNLKTLRHTQTLGQRSILPGSSTHELLLTRVPQVLDATPFLTPGYYGQLKICQKVSSGPKVFTTFAQHTMDIQRPLIKGRIDLRLSPSSPPWTKDIPEHVVSYSGAFSDFYGFPSHTISVYRTGDEWPVPKGPQGQRVPREARPVCNHPIQAVWRTLGKQVYQSLDSLGVLWSTIDLVRFAEEEGDAGPLYLWDAKAAAVNCKKILAAAQFPDIEIAFRESVYIRSSGPQLLNHVISVDPTADIRSPFTGALGVPIAPRNVSHNESTGALYLCEGGQSNKLYKWMKTGQPRHEILIFGSKAYSDALRDMMAKIGRKLIDVDYYKRELAALGEAIEGEDAMIGNDITKNWSTVDQRVLGHIVYAPPISVDAKQYTEDWALVELNHNKVDWNNFKGNVMYLGNKITVPDLVLKMHPHPEGRTSFKYPLGDLLQLKGVVQEKEIRQPTLLDANGEECVIVIKNGMKTGVTIGRGSGIESFVREYDDNGNIKSTSMEITIYPYNLKSGAFPAPGDSGSIVADGLGRIVGLLTGGSGKAEDTDVTYVTPYFWIEEQIKKAFPDSYLYPIKV